jgi:hypothetical protein
MKLTIGINTIASNLSTELDQATSEDRIDALLNAAGEQAGQLQTKAGEEIEIIIQKLI